jgi:hypothetical protein
MPGATSADLADLALDDHPLMPVSVRLDAVLIDAVLGRQEADDLEIAPRLSDVRAEGQSHRLAGLEFMSHGCTSSVLCCGENATPQAIAAVLR